MTQNMSSANWTGIVCGFNPTYNTVVMEDMATSELTYTVVGVDDLQAYHTI